MIELILDIVENIILASFTIAFLYVLFGRLFSTRCLRQEREDRLMWLKSFFCIKMSIYLFVSSVIFLSYFIFYTTTLFKEAGMDYWIIDLVIVFGQIFIYTLSQYISSRNF